MTTQISGDTGVSQCQPNSVSQDDLQAGVTGKGPLFVAVAVGGQAVVTGTFTKIAFDSEVVDTASCYDTSLFRFTPNVAGHYQVNIVANTQSNSGGFYVLARKNGAAVNNISAGVLAAPGLAMTVSGILFLNGSTDYLEAFFQHNGGSTLTCQGLHFSAALVRAA